MTVRELIPTLSDLIYNSFDEMDQPSSVTVSPKGLSPPPVSGDGIINEEKNATLLWKLSERRHSPLLKCESALFRFSLKHTYRVSQ